MQGGIGLRRQHLRSPFAEASLKSRFNDAGMRSAFIDAALKKECKGGASSIVAIVRCLPPSQASADFLKKSPPIQLRLGGNFLQAKPELQQFNCKQGIVF